MSLFEDPKLEYYRKWDRQYDEEKAKAEDARMLAYERKPLITLRSLHRRQSEYQIDYVNPYDNKRKSVLLHTKEQPEVAELLDIISANC